MRLFGSSGFRGVVDKHLIETAFKLGLSVGKLARSALIGTDPRISSDVMKYCMMGGLMASGCEAYDAGLVPTPTLAYNSREFEVGIMITASHNPPQYNGIKIWNPDGSAFNEEQRSEVEMLVANDNLEATSWELIGHSKVFPDAIDKHIQRILRDFPSQHPIKVIVDCGYGAASAITPILLQRLGCCVISLNSTPSGLFPRGTEPTPENLRDLAATVTATGSDLGLAHDPDADRLVVVDNRGRFVPGDKLMILFAKDLNARSIATTVDASMSIEECGMEVTRTRVGDAFVAEQLTHWGDFGGEPSGCWIFPTISYCPDAIYAAARIVRIATNEQLSEQIDRIPSYHIRRGALSSDNRIGIDYIGQCLTILEPISIDCTDGIRLSFNDGWLLLRASGTEPKIRLTAEAKTAKRADNLYNSAMKLAQELTGSSKSGMET